MNGEIGFGGKKAAGSWDLWRIQLGEKKESRKRSSWKGGMWGETKWREGQLWYERKEMIISATEWGRRDVMRLHSDWFSLIPSGHFGWQTTSLAGCSMSSCLKQRQTRTCSFTGQTTWGLSPKEFELTFPPRIYPEAVKHNIKTGFLNQDYNTWVV